VLGRSNERRSDRRDEENFGRREGGRRDGQEAFMSNRDPADVPRGGRYFEHDDRSRDDNSDDGRKRSVEMYDLREEVSTPRDRYSNKRSYGREDYSNEKR